MLGSSVSLLARTHPAVPPGYLITFTICWLKNNEAYLQLRCSHTSLYVASLYRRIERLHRHQQDDVVVALYACDDKCVITFVPLNDWPSATTHAFPSSVKHPNSRLVLVQEV